MKEFRECLGAHGFEAALPEKLHRLLAALLVRARYRLLHPIHLLLLPHLECIDFVFFCVWSPVIHTSFSSIFSWCKGLTCLFKLRLRFGCYGHKSYLKGLSQYFGFISYFIVKNYAHPLVL